MIAQNMKSLFRRINVVSGKSTIGRYISTSKLRFKIVKCKLFDIGEGISEVEITQWNKEEGDEVAEMESLLTVQSDKAAVDITSKYNGVLVKKYAKEKDIIKIGSYFCEIDTEDDITESRDEDGKTVGEEELGEEQEEEQGEELKITLNDDVDMEGAKNVNMDIMEKSVHKSSKQGNKINVKASPGVRKKVREFKLDLDDIATYLNKENITMEDVEMFKDKMNAKKEDGCNANMEIIEEVPLKGIKLAMCKSMNESLSIPLFHLNEMYNVKNLVNVRNEIKKNVQEKEENVNVTITSLLVKLISNTLIEFPLLNSKFNAKKNSYTVFKNHNVCVAMDTPNGLLVPNIKNVHKKNIVQIQKDLTMLRSKAMEMKLSKDDITGGTITISNFGAIAGTFATPIVFDNQACIIGISKMVKQICLKDGSKELTSISDLTISDTMNLTYGADHRFVDGATLAQFAKKLKEVVEGLASIDPFEA
ncbi:lipoamide acyltransferase component of branched-chain alpha-keto acid dehydrogenase complex, putative [Plasmodium ovale]|uniref:Dihydrolipoamide acetyltransferase component of pyruvate dehydrogenase complex n=2 Tax=Plasmodium ovale TaxID=36330 RepID=A0A1A8WDK2_PLAOA|nr:lipoamide acyltransferase component of branched-chain alpha-keto acid dehydrogenase complex, putative (BCKDH-E2) [Plasmodium ovale curtisi]SBS90112.1 lipoamide acyltransferase component of branched-chain alpha-keto acid dehydrogenase complex, putative (BCKDH-E2) [Plasmodium ovale curtisi]SCP04345.1 lipoamide acyltransferase component of branched-chain alpha-keto acid dehydrogenase complex, putative [Plasmodium ovale]